MNPTRGRDTERRGRRAGVLPARMSREGALACGRFPGTGDRALGQHDVEWQVDLRLMT